MNYEQAMQLMSAGFSAPQAYEIMKGTGNVSTVTDTGGYPIQQVAPPTQQVAPTAQQVAPQTQSPLQDNAWVNGGGNQTPSFNIQPQNPSGELVNQMAGLLAEMQKANRALASGMQVQSGDILTADSVTAKIIGGGN